MIKEKGCYHLYDLPSDVSFDGSIAVDTEAMGLNILRDRLCVVQISDSKGNEHLVHFPEPKFDAPNLKKLLADKKRQKIFHYARFDVAALQHYLDIEMANIYCTKIASRLCRTYTSNHGLKDLCQQLLGVKISKQQQTSDWGNAKLTQEQIEYALTDVRYLHQLAEILTSMLKREKRWEIAQKCFDFIPARATLDALGWNDVDILSHNTGE